MFKLASGLRPVEIGNKNGDLVALVKNEVKLTRTDKVSSSFLCVLALSSVIFQPIHLFYSKCGFSEYEKIFNQLIYSREKSNSNCKQMLFLVWTNSGGWEKKYYDKQSLCPSDKVLLGSEKNKKKVKGRSRM